MPLIGLKPRHRGAIAAGAVAVGITAGTLAAVAGRPIEVALVLLLLAALIVALAQQTLP